MSKFLNAIIIFLLVLVIGTGAYWLLFNKEINIKKIILDKSEISIYIKDENIIIPHIIPEDATNKNIIWKSLDENVAKVDASGVVSAVNEGETDIIATSSNNEVSASTHVKVFVREVRKIELSNQNFELRIGETKKLEAKVLPSNATYSKINYRSSNESVVKVDSKGNIESLKSGTADVIVQDERGKTESICKVKVLNSFAVKSVSLNISSSTLKIGEKLDLKATIFPDNAENTKVKWQSSDDAIASVDQNGQVTAKKMGVTSISAITEDGGKTSTCKVIVKANPIIPSSSVKKYESISLKYYVQNNKNYYLTYIWMDDPYNQIKKLDSMTSFYGKIMTDEEMEKNGKKPFRRTVGQMLTSYISNGMIPSSKAAVAFNASGFYVKGIWNPPSDYYHNRSDGWLVLNDGKITRNMMDDKNVPTRTIIGIDQSGNLKLYDGAKTNDERKKIYDAIIADGVKNTFSFNPKLVVNGKSVTSNNVKAQRQAICQIDSNNYLMYTSISAVSFSQIIDVFLKNKCITAFNLDGGGSTSFFYKDANSKSVHKMKCSDGNGSCRQVVEGIYFVEK